MNGIREFRVQKQRYKIQSGKQSDRPEVTIFVKCIAQSDAIKQAGGRGRLAGGYAWQAWMPRLKLSERHEDFMAWGVYQSPGTQALALVSDVCN